MKKHAFTLIELLVVIAIIGILAGMLLPSLHSARESAKAAACMSNCKTIATAEQMYASENDDFFVPYTSKGTIWYAAGGTVWPVFARCLGMPEECAEYDGAIVEDFQCPSSKGLALENTVDINGVKHYRMFTCYVLNGLGGWSGVSEGPRAGDGGEGEETYTTGQKLSQIRNPSRLVDWMDGTSPYCGNIFLSDCTLFSSYQKTEDETTGDRAVAYRHNDRANMAFFDGHAETRHYRTIEWDGDNSSDIAAHWINRSF